MCVDAERFVFGELRAAVLRGLVVGCPILKRCLSALVCWSC